MRKYTVRSRKLSQSYFEALMITLIIGFTLRWFVITPYKIPTDAMAPALMAGDYVFVFKLPYGVRLPFFKKIGEAHNLKIGDVVLFSYKEDPDTQFIKRVASTSNGEVVLQSSGDDSRYPQNVPIKNIEGKAFMIWFSYDSANNNIRWDRIFRSHL